MFVQVEIKFAEEDGTKAVARRFEWKRLPAGDAPKLRNIPQFGEEYHNCPPIFGAAVNFLIGYN